MDERSLRVVVVRQVDDLETGDRASRLIRLLATGIARRARERRSVDYVGDLSVDADVGTDDQRW
jgi:hypothetical protein